jgi:Mor family transcriptional regulator
MNIDMVHYVYKITNIKTNLFYIGSRSYPNPPQDEYMGSSKILNNLYQNEGINNFKKDILETFNTRELANKKEHELIEKYLKESPELIYNLRVPGIFGGKSGLYNKRRDLWEDYYINIRENYINGIKILELAKKYKCDIGTIHIIVKDLKIGRTWSNTWKLQNIIIDDYNKGYSVSFLSRKYKCDLNTIKSILIKNNIKIRNKQDQQNQNKILGIKQGKKKEVNLNLLKEYYLIQDLTLNETANKLNIGIDALKRIIIENNISVKSYSWSNKNPKHPAWEHKIQIQKDIKYISKKEILKKYNIQTYTTLNKILAI